MQDILKTTLALLQKIIKTTLILLQNAIFVIELK